MWTAPLCFVPVDSAERPIRVLKRSFERQDQGNIQRLLLTQSSRSKSSREIAAALGDIQKRMDENADETGPIVVPTENWEVFKERWHEVADLHDSGDVAGAVFQLKRLASEGFSPALAELGDKYEFGSGGIDVDLTEAVEWYKKSVEAIDDVRSHIGLARIYLQSKELDPDRSLSFYHLKVLADSDTMAGWFGLGLAFQHGVGTDVDLDDAEKCFRNAVEKGHLVAGTHLAQVLLATDKPGGFKTALRFIPRVLWMKLLRLDDPRLGFEYEPTTPT